MVLTLGNDHNWLGTLPAFMQFLFAFFHVVVCNFLFAQSIDSHSNIGKMTECFWQFVFEKFKFFSVNLSSLTCDLGALSLLSNRADSLAMGVVGWTCVGTAFPNLFHALL